MLTMDDLCADLTALGVTPGATTWVHSSLSSVGQVDGGAITVVRALQSAVVDGTVAMPTFTPEIRDPRPDVAADVVRPRAQQQRDAVPLFDPDTTPTSMGAIPAALLALPERHRSSHPQVSIAAVGAAAEHLCTAHPLGYALGTGGPFPKLVDLDATIMLIGVGHNRSSFLHHVETTLDEPLLRRRKLRRFPLLIQGYRAWVEVPDVGDDLDTHFPAVGAAFEATSRTLRRGRVGAATATAFSAREYVALTGPILKDRLASEV